MTMVPYLYIPRRVFRAARRFPYYAVKEVAQDLPRHTLFRYNNNKSLSPEYFRRAAESLDDPYLYIVLSSTGSPASQLLSVFTQREYNHVSLCFDKDLKTMVSYNGGEKIYPPGLNYERETFFHKKDDASLLVYKIPCTYEQKKMALAKVEAINKEGSAYNMLGIFLKFSLRPNIMFCSQFVYHILKITGLSYFQKSGARVKPMDFIELDCQSKLIFDHEVKFTKKIA